jgi:hypothetical protein
VHPEAAVSRKRRAVINKIAITDFFGIWVIIFKALYGNKILPSDFTLSLSPGYLFLAVVSIF